MGYIIYSNGIPEIFCTSYVDVRIWEAFFRGMQIDYSLTYPGGSTMKVNFKSNIMKAIEQLDIDIETAKKQLHNLSESKSISNKERNDLMRYYEEKIRSYTNRRDMLVKDIAVEAEVVSCRAITE